MGAKAFEDAKSERFGILCAGSAGGCGRNERGSGWRVAKGKKERCAARVPSERDLQLSAAQRRPAGGGELAPYRRKMQAAQIDLLQKQYLQKRLLERYGLPRLSLFYM